VETEPSGIHPGREICQELRPTRYSPESIMAVEWHGAGPRKNITAWSDPDDGIDLAADDGRATAPSVLLQREWHRRAEAGNLDRPGTVQKASWLLNGMVLVLEKI
jgi:hypothetical protein